MFNTQSKDVFQSSYEASCGLYSTPTSKPYKGNAQASKTNPPQRFSYNLCQHRVQPQTLSQISRTQLPRWLAWFSVRKQTNIWWRKEIDRKLNLWNFFPLRIGFSGNFEILRFWVWVQFLKSSFFVELEEWLWTRTLRSGLLPELDLNTFFFWQIWTSWSAWWFSSHPIWCGTTS